LPNGAILRRLGTEGECATIALTGPQPDTLLGRGRPDVEVLVEYDICPSELIGGLAAAAAPRGCCEHYVGAAATRLGGNTMPENAMRPAMIAFCLTAILLVTYLIALFVAGDFIIPVALALVGDPHDWLPTQVLGWASIVGLVFVTIWFRYDPLKLAIWQLTASIFLYLSWFAFAYFSARQSPLSVWTLKLSAPFQVAFVLVAGILIAQIARRHRERRATSSSSSNAP
jgi:hypothetical protein